MLKLYSDSSYKSVNIENKQLLEDYILELKSLGKSEGTIKQYQFDIKAFFCWLNDYSKNESILKLKKRTFRNFFLTMKDAGCSNARINRFQSSLRNLLQFAEDDEDEYDDYIINPMRKIKGLPKEEVREIYFIPDDKMVILLKELIARSLELQALWLMLSYESAGRRNEIAQVTKKSLIEGDFFTNEVIGKRAKKFKLIYFQDARDIALKLFKDNDDGLAFGDNVESARNRIYYWCLCLRDIYEELFGEKMNFNPHSLRHSALENYSTGNHYHLRQNNKQALSLDSLKIIAHHSDISTTQGYLIDHSDEKLKEELGI